MNLQVVQGQQRVSHNCRVVGTREMKTVVTDGSRQSFEVPRQSQRGQRLEPCDGICLYVRSHGYPEKTSRFYLC